MPRKPARGQIGAGSPACGFQAARQGRKYRTSKPASQPASKQPWEVMGLLRSHGNYLCQWFPDDSKALAFHFNHRSASIAAAIAYVITVLAVMCTATDVDSDDQLNDLFFTCHLGTGVCLATYWPLGMARFRVWAACWPVGLGIVHMVAS